MNLNLTSFEQSRRNSLRDKKPLVYAKANRINEKLSKGECAALISICYDYVCNMACEHCSNNQFFIKDRHFTIDDVKNLADQADDMGLFQFELSGGEPLLFPDLDDIISAIGPQRFHINLTTNGYFLSDEKAKHLKQLGVDKIKISVDCDDAELHVLSNGKNDAHSRAIDALFSAKKAGFDTVIQTVATKDNTRSANMLKLAQFAKNNGFTIDVVLAKPVGSWAGNLNVLVENEDIEYLKVLNNDYPMRRNIYPAYGRHGCPSVSSFLCITKYGDVLPCTFIPISIGNIFEESLKEITNRGLRIKWFKGCSDICLAGQNREFIKKYISKTWGKKIPLSWKEVFTKEDFVDGIMI